jgi:hypothetical protein
VISQGHRVRAYNGMLDVLRKGNLTALLIPIVLLLMGWGARAALSRKTLKYSWHGMTLSHPAGWALTETTGDGHEADSVVLMDLLGPGRIKPRLTLRITTVEAPKAAEPAPAEGEADAPAAPAQEAATNEAPKGEAKPEAPAEPAPIEPASKLPLYYRMAEEPVQIGTFSGTRVDSAFAFTPPPVFGRKRDIPVVMRAIDVVIMRGSQALSAQIAAPIEVFETIRPNLESLVASLQIEPLPVSATPVEPAPPAAPEPEVARGVTVSGQVVDAQSGLAVPGAIVLFLAPGTSVSDVDDDNLTRAAYTTALADSTGHFAANRALLRQAHYGVMVVADGYRWIGTDEAVEVRDDGPQTLDMGSIPLRHR